ncbi:MAG: oligosaccharide flippase family protein [Alphaproteobacteria bacterium]|nr:oligosaccharide flippase family protein [Alphaproteobacteria bacterium]
MAQPLSEGGRIARNFAALFSSQAAAAAAGLVATAFLARMLGTESFGVLGFGVAILSYFGLLVTLGTDVYGAREIAQTPARAARLVHDLLGLRTATVAAVSVLYFVVVFALDLPERVRVVLWIQGAGLLATAYTLDFVFQGLQRMGAIAARQTMASALSLALVLLVVRTPEDVYLAALAPVAAGALTAGWLALRMHRAVLPFGIAVRPAAWRPMLKASLPIAVAQLMGAVFFYIDIVMLGFMETPHLVGVYVGMSRVLMVTLVAAGLIGSVFLPVVAAAWPDAGPMRARYRDFMIAALLAGAPVALAGMAFPAEIVSVIFGAPYLGGTTALTILMGMTLAAYLAMAPAGALTSWHDQTWHMVAFSAGGVANVALNLVLIPRYGIEGAATATLLAQLLVLAVAATRIWLRFRLFEMGPAAALVLAAAIAAAAARWLADAVLGDAPALAVLAVGGTCGAAIYLGLVAAMRIVPLRRLRGAVAGRLRKDDAGDR